MVSSYLDACLLSLFEDPRTLCDLFLSFSWPTLTGSLLIYLFLYHSALSPWLLGLYRSNDHFMILASKKKKTSHRSFPNGRQDLHDIYDLLRPHGC